MKHFVTGTILMFESFAEEVLDPATLTQDKC